MHLGKVLIAGCGGTGSELVKLLLVSKHTFDSLMLIDYDTVEFSNLSRQFYFTENDLAKSKSMILYQKIIMYMSKRKLSSIPLIEYKHDKLENDNNHYDYVFSCVDNIEGRMSLNISNFHCLIDLGVEDNKCHVKKVVKGSEQSCLYCLRSLYKNDKILFCTYKSIDKITARQELISHFINRYESTEDVVKEFNKVSDIRGIEYVSTEEIDNLKNDIIANVCYINAICASFAVLALENKIDFLFYNNGSVTKIDLDRDPKCIVCSRWKD